MCRQSEGLIIRKSDSNNRCSGRRPVRWTETSSKQRSRPRSLSGKIICAPACHSPYKAAYQISSLQLKQFCRYVRSYAENCRGHVTYATPTFGENYLCACSAFQIQSCIPNSPGWGDNCGSESFTLETDVCGWRYAPLVVLATQVR